MSGLGPAPYLDVAATFDPAGRTATLLVLNRDLENRRELQVDWQGVTPAKVQSSLVLTCPDLKAANTFDAPRRVVPQALEAPKTAPRMTFELPARSYATVTVAV